MSSPEKKRSNTTRPEFTGKYSWVNKGADNIDRKDHSTTVAWHLSNRYEKWKKQEQLKHSMSPMDSPDEPGPSGSIRHVSPDIPHNKNQRPHITNWRVQPMPRVPLDSSAYTQSGQEFLAGAPSSSTSSSSPRNFTPRAGAKSGSPEMPFAGAYQAPLGTQPVFPTGNPFDFAQNFLFPTLWPSINGTNEWNIELSYAKNDLISVQSCPSYASAWMYFFRNVSLSLRQDKEMAQQSIQSRQTALEALKHHRSSGNHTFLKATLRMFSAETIVDRSSVAREHLKSLQAGVVAHGGINALDPWLRQNILAADCYFALKYGTRPQFGAAEWTPGTLKHPVTGKVAKDQTGKKRELKVHLTIEHAALRNIVVDLKELFTIHSYVQSAEYISDATLSQWSHLRRLDCLNRLADHRVNVRLFPHLYLLPKFQLAMCTSIALMTAMLLGSPEPVRFGMQLISQLQFEVIEAQGEVDFTIQGDARDRMSYQSAFMWMFYVGMLASQVHPVADPQWFSKGLHGVKIQLNVQHSTDMKNILVQFLHSTSLEDEIVRGRPHREEQVMNGYYELCGLSWRQPCLETLVQR